MTGYALLILPAANRVYAEAAAGLTQAELAAFNETVLAGRLGEVDRTSIGGLPYVTFATANAKPLAAADQAYLANLSSGYALFERDGDLLRPVELHPLDRFDDDLLTIQKYAGKTNEHFTKLLLNVTVLASDGAGAMLERKLDVLDPLCGRGTTLNQALMYGFNATGVEVEPKDFDAYELFVKTWLKRKRLKHKAEAGTIRRNREVLGRRLHATIGVDRERYKAGDTLELTMYNADTLRALELLRPGTFDAVVTDAPYGVRHGSRSAATAQRSRSPLDLLRAAVPIWAALLRPGGAVGVALNVNVARREAVAEILSSSGLSVVESSAYQGFAHRVDQAIVRDVVVARKPP